MHVSLISVSWCYYKVVNIHPLAPIDLVAFIHFATTFNALLWGWYWTLYYNQNNRMECFLMSVWLNFGYHLSRDNRKGSHMWNMKYLYLIWRDRRRLISKPSFIFYLISLWIERIFGAIMTLTTFYFTSKNMHISIICRYTYYNTK